MTNDFRSGYVSIIGRPMPANPPCLTASSAKNIHRYIRPQTTRRKITGISSEHTRSFVDTPGIHKPRHHLGRLMVREAKSS